MLLGADGGSPWPIGSWLEERRRNPAALNLAVAVGHATVRQQVLQEDFRRVARPTEVASMAKLVEQGMSEGALGLSSGLEYDVASYSSTDEVVAVAAAAAKHGGFYMTHVRDEADRSFEALEEEIAIGQRARIPVQHSHIKLGTVSVWGKAAEYVRVIEDARRNGLDFLADCYPYDAWYSTIKVLVPDKQYESPSSVKEALAAVGGAGNVTIANFAPDKRYEQQTIEQLAQKPAHRSHRHVHSDHPRGQRGERRRVDHRQVDDGCRTSSCSTNSRWVMVASDGGIDSQHPRGAGTFPRVLGRFVRERHWLTVPEAVRKMTSLPAQRLGLRDRGTLRKGTFADLVLFDPETVIDRATFAQPFELPTGIKAVFVNGEKVWSEDRPTG